LVWPLSDPVIDRGPADLRPLQRLMDVCPWLNEASRSRTTRGGPEPASRKHLLVASAYQKLPAASAAFLQPHLPWVVQVRVYLPVVASLVIVKTLVDFDVCWTE
jgi:hypothetical protein